MKKRVILLIGIIVVIIIAAFILFYTLKKNAIPEDAGIYMVRTAPSAISLNDTGKVSLTIQLENASDVKSVLIAEYVPAGFEISDINPEPSFFYQERGVIVWGKEDFVPNSGEVFSYNVRAVNMSETKFGGLVGEITQSGNELEYHVVGDDFISVNGSKYIALSS